MVVRAIEKQDWERIASIVHKNKDFMGELGIKNTASWVVEILKNRFSFMFDKGIIITKDISQQIKLIDDGSGQPSKLKVLYYMFPQDEKAVVEYIAVLQKLLGLEVEAVAIKQDINTNGTKKTTEVKSSREQTRRETRRQERRQERERTQTPATTTT